MMPEPGQIVRVRARRYLVEHVVRPPHPGEQTLVRMSCLDDDAQGVPLEVLWEHELDAEILSHNSWKRVAERGFDDPRRFSAYLHAQRWNCVTSTNPRLFQAPYRAGIEVMAYQLEPLRMALALPRVNLFIADDVGLGKTIEAGLIVRELIMRQKVRRIIVACPPSVLWQWRDELDSRFGLSFEIFDRDFVLARRRERGYGTNPWDTHTRFLISHALLRDETYAGPLRDSLGSFQPGSLFILDEAHNAAPASSSKYAIDSHLTRAVRDLGPRFEHRLFLSATPHNGHSNSFAALLEILDPHRFCRGVPVRSARALEPIMVRRLKSDLRGIVDGIPERKIEQIDIRGLPEDAPELVLARLLEEYRQTREARMQGASRTAQAASALVVTSLQKRLLSSVEAFACTLRVHRRTLERKEQEETTGPLQPQEPTRARKQAGPWPGLGLDAASVEQAFPLLASPPGADDEGEMRSEAELQADEEAEIQRATAAATPAAPPAAEEPAALARRERQLLDEMTRIAEAARQRPDARVNLLIDWIRQHLCPGLVPRDPGPKDKKPPAGALPAWNERRLLIFTEYLDTKRYLEQRLREAIAYTDQAEERIACFVGGRDETREDIKRAFNADPARHPLRILIATDAAREGVNLQNHCADLFHFDVPWNPGRLEQRNGRIDRKLQRAQNVWCRYFYYEQRPEDRVLRALVRKTQTIQEELGSLSKVIERRLERMFEQGIPRTEASRLAGAIEQEDLDPVARATAEEELETIRTRRRKVSGQIDQLRDLLETSRKHLDLDERHFRDALSVSLELQHAAPLAPVTPDEATRAQSARGEPAAVWRFPDLDRRHGADASWTETLDSLRAPRKKDQKPWEWRKTSPIRPVVFRDIGSLDDSYVHLHLEHRVAQRLLGRFLAEGFVHDDLSRACVVRTQDAIPRVVLLGRLSLYGDQAARLHDEILTVTARWIDPETRRDPLKPYATDAEERTLRLLEETFAAPDPNGRDGRDGHAVGPDLAERLRQAVERDVAELLAPLQARAEESAARARKKLGERGEREAEEMVEVLRLQMERIEEELGKQDDPQQRLRFSADEERQREADRRHMADRLGGIRKELDSEPARIRKSYEVRALRVEPLGLVYLWPLSS